MAADNVLVTRVKRLKIYLTLVVFALLGAGSYVLSALSRTRDLPGLLDSLPWTALGDACVSVVLIGTLYEVLVRQENEDKQREIIKRLLAENNLRIRYELSRSSLFDHDILRQFPPDEIDRIALRALEVRLGDSGLAVDTFKSVLDELFSYPVRYENFRSTLTLTPDDEAGDQSVLYFNLTVTNTFETRLRRDRLLFGTCRDAQSMRSLQHSPDRWDYVWTPGKTKDYSFDDERGFRVKYAQVGNLALDVAPVAPEESGTRHSNGASLRYVASHENLTKLVGQPVVVEYQCQVKVAKRGHLIYYPLTQPTRKVEFQLLYHSTDIGMVNVLPFLLSAQDPIVRRADPGERNRMATVRLDGWALPGSGVAFVWNLDAEWDDEFVELLRRETFRP